MPAAPLKISVLQTDITRLSVDAIVNAANSSLMGGGGVDGAIHRAGGPAILEACKKIVAAQGPLAPGGAVLTTGGRLPAHFVIHTVGPVWHGGSHGEAETLARCYTNSLQCAADAGCTSIAFPAISTGVYGYPKKAAAQVAAAAVTNFFKTPCLLAQVIFACFDSETKAFLEAALDKQQP